jgi:ATP-dependent DNA helicase RecG
MVIQQKVKKVPSQAEAIRIFNYPYQALEEIVVNALYHRSYQEREPVEISIMPDKIEIVSYSGADRSIRLADLRAGKRVRARRYRNRRLGDFLKELDLTEGRGTGIPTVKKELEKNGSSKAMFDSDDERTFFFVSIPCHADFLCEEITVDTKGHIIENVSVNKSDIREQIFNLIVHNNHITRKSIAEAVGINPSAVQRHIQILIKNGDIERKGKTRSSYFIVLRKTIK